MYREPPTQYLEDRMFVLEKKMRHHEEVHDRNIFKMNKTWLAARLVFALGLAMLSASIALQVLS